MNGKKAKQMRKEARQQLAESGWTPDHIRETIERHADAQAVLISRRKILNAARPKPKILPKKAWEWLIGRVFDLERLK